MNPILITGSTGKVGNVVAHELLRRGERVRAVVHRVDERSRRLQEAGAEAVVVDLFDPEGMTRAMDGIEAAFFLPPLDQYMLHAAAVFAVAARTAGVRSVVALSQWLSSPSHPSLLTRHHWLADELFGMLPGVARVTVNPGFFADNYLSYGLMNAAIHLGIYPNPYGASSNAPPSNEDIASVVVEALLDPLKHDGRVYRPTGPALLTPHEIGRIIARVAGRRVRTLDVPLPVFRRAVRAAGVPSFMQANVLAYRAECLSGAFAVGAPTNHVREVTGRDPEDFEATVRRYASMPQSQPTFANRLNAAIDFMKIPLTIPEDLERYERLQHFPAPPNLHSSAASPTWRRIHEFMAATGTAPADYRSAPATAGI